MARLLFSGWLKRVGGGDSCLTEDAQRLAGNAGDLELVLLGDGQARARVPDQIQRFLKRIWHRCRF